MAVTKSFDKLILPTLAEHGIDKDYPVWEVCLQILKHSIRL